MKTPELKRFYKSLSELNNSFTHYSLVWNQFGLDYSEMFKNSPETLTKDYFKDNPYRRKHNIKFGELEIEHIKINDTLIQGIFLLIYTHFESYLKNLIIFSSKVDENIKPLENKIEDSADDYLLIHKVFNRINIDKSLFQIELLLTLDYIRLKRNRLIHSNSENISSSLNDIIKINGASLNNYWNNILPSKLQGIDFTNKHNANELNFNIIIDTINIFRSISSETDIIITNKITSRAITEKIIIPKFLALQNKKIKSIKFDRLANKYIKFSELEFGLDISDEFLDILKSSIA